MLMTDSITVMGRVVNDLPGRFYRVELDNGYEVLCYLSGKLIKHKIRLTLGDRVEVEMSSYDLSKGRIVYRHKD